MKFYFDIVLSIYIRQSFEQSHSERSLLHADEMKNQLQLIDSKIKFLVRNKKHMKNYSSGSCQTSCLLISD